MNAAYPHHVPVIVISPLTLPQSKFLIPRDYTVAKFFAQLRHKLMLSPDQAVYLMARKNWDANQDILLSASETFDQVAVKYTRPGEKILYLSLLPEQVYGHGSSLQHLQTLLDLRTVQKEKHAFVVMITASWYPPCRYIGPWVAAVCMDHQTKLYFVDVDQAHPDLLDMFGALPAVPAFAFFDADGHEQKSLRMNGANHAQFTSHIEFLSGIPGDIGV